MSDSAAPLFAEDSSHVNLPLGFEVLADDEEISDLIQQSLDEVEKRLLEELSSSDKLLNSSARYLAEAGGKRVRPLLTILSALLGEGVNEDVLQAAVVLEMTHLATLYHDDVMDSAPLRRGAPSAHEVWNNSVAILTGDVILARASRLMSGLGTQGSIVQAKTFERLVTGQLNETVGPQEDEDAKAHYLKVIADKTGSLVASSSRLGGYFGGSSVETVALLEEYGEAVGVAFQLADDVIDLRATGEESGKTPGTDLREAVPTLPVLLLREIAAGSTGVTPQEQIEAQKVLGLVDGDLTSDEALAQAVAAVVEHPVMDQAWATAQAWADKAKAAISALPDSTVKEALLAFADAVVDREG